MNRKLLFVIIGFIFVIWLILIGFLLFSKDNSEIITISTKSCSYNNDCFVLGEDGDCGCGCYNGKVSFEGFKKGCDCKIPSSCKCVSGRCESDYSEEELVKDCSRFNCPSNIEYVGSKNSDKYYKCDCHYADRINIENIVCFESEEDAEIKSYIKSEC